MTTRPNMVLRIVMIVLALALPALSLLVLGSLWLWQHGVLLYWALAACAVTMAVYGYELWRLQITDAPKIDQVAAKQTDQDTTGPDRGVETEKSDDTAQGSDEEPVVDNDDVDPVWTEPERRAWDMVKSFGAQVDVRRLNGRKAVLDLGRDTVLLVAQTLHPDQRDPALHFTLPEALALIEQVSKRLRPFLIKSVPLGDQITVGQAMRLYRWRSVIGMASKAYDLWRIIRLMNPAAAVTQEMREKVTRKFYDWGREALARKLVQRYVEEVGRGAIDLYAGRLKTTASERAAHVTARSHDDLLRSKAQLKEPLRIVVAGQVGAGKSSLINALAQELRARIDVLPSTGQVSAHMLKKNDQPVLLFLDMPGLNGRDWNMETFIDETATADLVIWVSSALRADREMDRQALAGLKRCSDDVDGAVPGSIPLLVVMTHVDQLRPFSDWHPPYDLQDTANAKSRSIVAARAALSNDLSWPVDRIIAVCLGQDRVNYNIEGIWHALHDALSAAKAVRLNRIMDDIKPDFSWRRLGDQAVQGAKSLKRMIKK